MNRIDAARRRTGLVTIVVPAKDEAEAIADCLQALPVSTLEAAGYSVEIFVLDGNSTDGTAEVAKALGAAVIPDRSHGKGAAFRDALESFHGDYIVMLDADGSYAPDAIPSVVEPLARGEADVVMGDRHPLPGAMTTVHKVGNALLTMEASVLFGRRCHDLCTGLWGFRAGILRELPLRSQGFELEADLFAMSARKHCRVTHAPVDYLPRTGETKLSATRDGLRIGWWLIRSRFASLHPPGTSRPPRPQRRPVSEANPARSAGEARTWAAVSGVAQERGDDDDE